MANMVGTTRINVFGAKVFVKGFSRMLVPVNRLGNMLLWHLLSHPESKRISYLDTANEHIGGLAASDIPKYRHVLGWCPQVDCYAGE